MAHALHLVDGRTLLPVPSSRRLYLTVAPTSLDHCKTRNEALLCLSILQLTPSTSLAHKRRRCLHLGAFTSPTHQPCWTTESCQSWKICCYPSPSLSLALDDGRVKCQCPASFKSDGVKNCEDTDECKEKKACQCLECSCKNTWGSYDCTCNGDLLYIKDHDTCISKTGSNQGGKSA